MVYKKVLIINIFGIGDVLFTTPLISHLKEHYPEMHIAYVCNRRTAPILADNPKINKIYIYERDEYQAIYKKSKKEFLKKLNGALHELKQEKFNVVIDLSSNSSAGFLMWFIGIKNRAGINYRNRSPFLNSPLCVNGFEGRHVVEYYLSFLKDFGITANSQKPLEITINPNNLLFAESWFKSNNLTAQDKIVCIVPGGGASWGKESDFKRWGAPKYAKLADKIIEKFNAKVILMGDENEKELCAQVGTLMRQRPIMAGGETTIGQFAALLNKCNLAVVNDGGPLHVAVAVGLKTISIFGPVDEVVYGPYPLMGHAVVRKGLTCQPCYRNFRMSTCRHISCLNNIEVDEVFEKVSSFLK